MAKNPNKKAKALQKDEQMNGAMKFFLAGCVAELYLLIIRRFYINADSELSRIAWYDRYLWMLAGIGAGVLAVGLIAALTAKANAGRRKTAGHWREPVRLLGLPLRWCAGIWQRCP